MEKIKQYRTDLEQRKGRKKLLQEKLDVANQKLEKLSENLFVAEEARQIIQKVAKMTQSQLEYRIGHVVSNALSVVFDKPYTFKVEFVLRRDKTEADLLWQQDNKEVMPNGGGVRDISSFAMRVAMWNLQPNKSALLLILDEPFKHLKPFSAQKRAMDLLLHISKELNLQIIMVTSAESDKHASLIQNVDTAYEVKKVENVSQIFNLKEG